MTVDADWVTDPEALKTVVALREIKNGDWVRYVPPEKPVWKNDRKEREIQLHRVADIMYDMLDVGFTLTGWRRG